jgi:hypothetical protein
VDLNTLDAFSINSPGFAVKVLEFKSVKGGQWLRAPLIFTTGRGEIFATQESRLMRERAAFERQVSERQLELRENERQIRVRQHDIQIANQLYGSSSSFMGDILSGNIQSAIQGGLNLWGNIQNLHYIQQLRNLKEYSYARDFELINMAYRNNLTNINLQENIRRVAIPEVVFVQNDSMVGYEHYNGFMISLNQPDIDYLIGKDIEYSKYGYPVYESVRNFNILNNLRVNHTVYQFQNPIIELGGKVGDLARNMLSTGVRILSNRYSENNLINNPKVGV